jgi:hypothetical protein
MLKEEYLRLLLESVYQSGPLNLFDFTAAKFGDRGEEFLNSRNWAGQLVKEKLVQFSDPEKTTLEITNYGRYWIMKGGYSEFLRESIRKKEEQRNRDQEKERIFKEKEALLEARLKLTHFRLTGFWLSLVISVVGFALSLFNLYLILSRNK